MKEAASALVVLLRHLKSYTCGNEFDSFTAASYCSRRLTHSYLVPLEEVLMKIIAGIVT